MCKCDKCGKQSTSVAYDEEYKHNLCDLCFIILEFGMDDIDEDISIAADNEY